MASKLEAVESLMELGLTEYEARCFVALTQLSEGTAKEISRIADVPQSRVYDVAEELHQLGVVDVQESEPRRYNVLPLEESLERLRRQYDDALNEAATQLQELETRDTDGDGVWEVADQEGLLERLVMHLRDAGEEAYLLFAVEEMVDRDVLDALGAASERGVAVYAEVPTESVRQRVGEAVPGSEVVVSDLPLASITVRDRKPGRLALIDRETVVLSALQQGLVPGECEETGLWGSGVGNGVVVWLRSLLERRLRRQGFVEE